MKFAHHHLAILVAVTAVCLAPARAAPAGKPITTDQSKVGELLRQWAAEGTAAGNTGDWYDNRDGGHSMLDLRPYPQLQLVPYSEDDIKAQRHWALAVRVLPQVTFGNSSTSAPPTASGSNGRQAYCSPGGLAMLARQYRANNLYLYPEHRDHDPATAAENGDGDLFPTSTPYLMLSQGSSGSDQPFMRAVPFTLAAFRPDVKKLLVEKGLLMPAVQMILRQTYRALDKPADYLTGRAHPTVFEGTLVDSLRMVQLAHEITADRVPPLVRLDLVDSDSARAGRDYFDPMPSEILSESEGAIAHIFRAATAKRRLVVSAEKSFDANKRPLEFHWVVLRGPADCVEIKPLNPEKSRAEITFRWHGRAPVAPGSQLESSRVDVGVFAHNGAYFSAPAFVTSFTLPSESRTYAGDRLLEIGYRMGESRFAVHDWAALHRVLTAEPLGPVAKMVLDGLTPAQVAAVRKLAADYQDTAASADIAEQQRKNAEEILKMASDEKKKELEPLTKIARDKASETATARDAVLARQLDGFSEPWKEFAPRRLHALAGRERLFLDHAATFAPLPASAEAQRKRLIALGVVSETTAPLFVPLPLEGLGAGRLSDWQHAQLARFHGDLLAALLPGVTHQWYPFLVDYRLTFPKEWRDVYHYSAAGPCTGWTRHTATGPQDFTPDGLAVLACDPLGRCSSASPVQYQVAPQDAKPRPPWECPPMSYTIQPRIVTYEYLNDADRLGRAVEELPSPGSP